jgi:hypothetical protein
MCGQARRPSTSASSSAPGVVSPVVRPADYREK